MKTIYVFFFALAFCISGAAQNLKPVKWSFEVVPQNDQMYEIHFKAKMDNKWAIYSQFTDKEGPVPTTFNFEVNNNILLEKEIMEVGELISGYDELFEINVKKFKGTVDFIQTVRLESDESHLKGFVTFMTCDDKRCLPPTDKAFSILIK